MSVKQAVKARIPDPARPYVKRAYLRTRAHPMVTRAARLRAAKGFSENQKHLLMHVDTHVSPNDGMAAKGWTSYFAVGLDAVRCIDAAMAATSADPPERILDLPCGWGRVMRFLAVRFPGADLVGCDVVDDAIRFCAERFGALSVPSSSEFDQVEIPGTFDLIWCGSLVTHLDAGNVDSLLRLFARKLSDAGVVVVSTHGKAVERRLRAGDPYYLLGPAHTRSLLARYERDGFGYSDYARGTFDHEPVGYGLSLMSPEWMHATVARAGLYVTYFAEQAWAGRHDIFCLARQR